MGCSFFFPFCDSFVSLRCDKYFKSLPTSNNVTSASIILPVTCCSVGHKNAFATQGQCVCVRVCVRVLLLKASSCRARQFMGGVPWTDISVQIRPTSKQVVVQRCGLTSDRKSAPRPPAPAHPRQNQYMWTLKCMQPESTCKSAAEHAQHKTPDFLGYSALFSGLCCPQQPRQTALEAINREKTLTVPESLFRRERVPLRMHGCMEIMLIKQHSF